MKRPVQYPEARRILGKVPVENAFWLCTNDNLRSLTEIAEALKKVDDEVFRYHVTRDKNDFEAWMRETVLDKELAREIARVKTKETLIRKITERTEGLRKVVKRHQTLLKRKKARAVKSANGRKAKSGKSLKRKAKKTRVSVPKKAKPRRRLVVAAIARR